MKCKNKGCEFNAIEVDKSCLAPYDNPEKDCDDFEQKFGLNGGEHEKR